MTETTSREEHLQWCKDRAYEYIDAGDLQNAFASFGSDITKHEGTRSIAPLFHELGFRLMLSGHLDTPAKMREHIEGYN